MHWISGNYSVSGIIRNFFTIRPESDITSVREYIRLKFDIIKLIFSYTNVLDNMFMILSYTLSQNYNFRILSRNPIGYPTRRNCLLRYSIGYQISDVIFCLDIRYSVSGNFTIRCIPSFKRQNVIAYYEISKLTSIMTLIRIM